jgi:hypothetical protein
MNLASRLSVSLRLAAIVGALCSACTDIESPAQIAVLVDADFNVRARVSSIEVELQSGPSNSDAGDTRVASRLVPKPGLDGWPLHVALHAPQGTTNRLTVTATAKDAAGMTIAWARVVRDSHATAPLELVLRFDANCAARSEPCGATQTCRDGACVDADSTPVDSPLPDGGSSISDDGSNMPDGGSTAPGGGSGTPDGGSSTPDGGASCAGGACAADGCGANRGGCDPLAECKLDSKNKPICGVCPVGFAGSGGTGCIATLIDLKLSGATLQPEFSADQTDYQAELPLLAESPILHPSQAAGVTVRIDGAVVESEAGWTAPEIAAGNSLKVSVIASAPAHVGRTYTLTLQRTLRAPAVLKAQNPAADDQFGVEIALSGDTFVTGAPSEDGGPNSHPGQFDDARKDSGAAYVFARKGNAWVQQAYLKADPPVEGANFGTSVAIDGDRIAIGARNDTGSGAVYIFERTADTWRKTDRLAIENASSNIAFGATVALHGERLAIGAVAEASGASDSGAVFMYEHSAAGWARTARLKASKPGPLDWLGSSVAFDGDVLVTGATGQFVDGNPCGATHVFVRNGTAWNDQGILPATGLEAGALFGTTVAISGDTIAVGAFNGTAGLTSGAVFLFVRDGTSWRQEGVVRAANPGSGDYFGLRLALATDRLLVGASRQSVQNPMSMGSLESAGSAYVFERDSGVWRQTVQLTAAPAVAQQQFGCSVALAGQTLAIAARGDGSAGAGAVLVFE